MRVVVELQGPLQKYGKGAGIFEYETGAESCSIKELLAELGVPLSAISFVTVDKGKRNLDYRLTGGERIVVYPQVVGG